MKILKKLLSFLEMRLLKPFSKFDHSAAKEQAIYFILMALFFWLEPLIYFELILSKAYVYDKSYKNLLDLVRLIIKRSLFVLNVLKLFLEEHIVSLFFLYCTLWFFLKILKLIYIYFNFNLI